MKRLHLNTLGLGLVAALGAGALAAGDYGGGHYAGGYSAPDPGRYDAGSAQARYPAANQPDAGDRYGFYGERWGRPPEGDSWGAYGNNGRSDGWSSTPAERFDPSYAGESQGDIHDPYARQAPSGWPSTPAYGDPLYGSPGFDEPRSREPQPFAGDYGYGQPSYEPPVRQRYRFRDDPRFDDKGLAEGNSGYQFRPLTGKELERRGEGYDEPAPSMEPAYPYYGESPGVEDQGAAFGYQPDPLPGSFYDRYYRSGP